jgi:hypothetical protein
MEKKELQTRSGKPQLISVLIQLANASLALGMQITAADRIQRALKELSFK